jgi:hypothetical protein
MDTVKQRPAVAANNHRWPAAAASELVTSGHITHRQWAPMIHQPLNSSGLRWK